MLGISAGREQRTIDDFQNPIDYISYLYTGIKGWICRGQIAPDYRQDMYRFNGLMGETWEGDNIYISMNSFCVNERTVERLKRLNTLYVDIDCYKLGLNKMMVLEELELDYFEKVIPTPTFVIDSGRGLYLIWKLRNEDRNALPRWTKVQNYLIDTLKGFGADPACKDSARILRIPFSRNTNSGTMVDILWFCDLTYTISDIQQEYHITGEKYKRRDGEQTHPYNTATEPMRRYALQLAFKLGVTPPDFDDFFATQEWIAKMRISTPCRPCGKEMAVHFDPKENTKMCHILQGYCADIETLFSIRRGTDCKRELALFLYRLYCYEITGDKHLALERTLAFNAKLSCPFPENYVIRATKSAETKIDKGDTYHYKKETIIEILEITGEEMKHLTYLVGEERRRERKQENNRKNYLDRIAAAGKETKAEARKKRRAAIVAMQKDGKGEQEIISALSISRATYYRELVAIAANNVIDAARDVLEKGVEKLEETVENAVETIIDVSKQITETAKTFTSALREGNEYISYPEATKKEVKSGSMGRVSKIQPYNYKRMAKPCRTAMDSSSPPSDGVGGAFGAEICGLDSG